MCLVNMLIEPKKLFTKKVDNLTDEELLINLDIFAGLANVRGDRYLEVLYEAVRRLLISVNENKQKGE